MSKGKRRLGKEDVTASVLYDLLNAKKHSNSIQDSVGAWLTSSAGAWSEEYGDYQASTGNDHEQMVYYLTKCEEKGFTSKVLQDITEKVLGDLDAQFIELIISTMRNSNIRDLTLIPGINLAGLDEVDFGNNQDEGKFSGMDVYRLLKIADLNGEWMRNCATFQDRLSTTKQVEQASEECDRITKETADIEKCFDNPNWQIARLKMFRPANMEYVFRDESIEIGLSTAVEELDAIIESKPENLEGLLDTYFSDKGIPTEFDFGQSEEEM